MGIRQRQQTWLSAWLSGPVVRRQELRGLISEYHRAALSAGLPQRALANHRHDNPGLAGLEHPYGFLRASLSFDPTHRVRRA
jgi:hypothetical protein